MMRRGVPMRVQSVDIGSTGNMLPFILDVYLVSRETKINVASAIGVIVYQRVVHLR